MVRKVRQDGFEKFITVKRYECDFFAHRETVPGR